MTSPTCRRKRKRFRCSLRPARRACGEVATARSAARAGFSLIELVLVLAISATLLSLVVINFTALRLGQNLEQGALQVETLIRLVRAEAAATGRQFRLAFEQETGRLRVLWESQPLRRPGEFVRYRRASWADCQGIEELVRVLRCELNGADALRFFDGELARADEEDALQAVAFFPDGSSNSAELELGAVQHDPDDPAQAYRAILSLDGLNGLIVTKLLTPSEYEEYLDRKPNSPGAAIVPKAVLPPAPPTPRVPRRPPAPGKKRPDLKRRPGKPSLVG